MVISIDPLYLRENKINAHQFLILYLLMAGEYKSLEEYLLATGTMTKLEEDVEYLIKLKFIEPGVDSSFSVRHIKLTDRFEKYFKKPPYTFERLYDAYPVKVQRPEGSYEYLRLDRQRAKKVYDHLVRNDYTLAKRIYHSLLNELDWRSKSNKMAYMRKLYNWLANGEWKRFDDNGQGAVRSKAIEKYGEEVV